MWKSWNEKGTLEQVQVKNLHGPFISSTTPLSLDQGDGPGAHSDFIKSCFNNAGLTKHSDPEVCLN